MNISPEAFATTQTFYCLVLTAPIHLIWDDGKVNLEGLAYIREQAAEQAKMIVAVDHPVGCNCADCGISTK